MSILKARSPTFAQSNTAVVIVVSAVIGTGAVVFAGARLLLRIYLYLLKLSVCLLSMV